MSYELEGILHKIFPTETKTANLDTRDFVVMVPGQYPEHIRFQLKNMKCALIDGMKEGSTVKVTFDISGREWQDKYFVNLVAWKVDTVKENDLPPGVDDITDATVVDDGYVQPF